MYRYIKSDYIDMMMSKHQTRNDLGMALNYLLFAGEGRTALIPLILKEGNSIVHLYYVDG